MRDKIKEHFDHIKSVLNKDDPLLIKEIRKIAMILERNILLYPGGKLCHLQKDNFVCFVYLIY